MLFQLPAVNADTRQLTQSIIQSITQLVMYNAE